MNIATQVIESAMMKVYIGRLMDRKIVAIVIIIGTMIIAAIPILFKMSEIVFVLTPKALAIDSIIDIVMYKMYKAIYVAEGTSIITVKIVMV
jgi:hypothetical protein